MSFLQHDKWTVSLDGIRAVIEKPSRAGGGTPYHDSALLRYADGTEYEIPLPLAKAISAKLTEAEQ